MNWKPTENLWQLCICYISFKCFFFPCCFYFMFQLFMSCRCMCTVCTICFKTTFCLFSCLICIFSLMLHWRNSQLICRVLKVCLGNRYKDERMQVPTDRSQNWINFDLVQWGYILIYLQVPLSAICWWCWWSFLFLLCTDEKSDLFIFFIRKNSLSSKKQGIDGIIKCKLLCCIF